MNRQEWLADGLSLQAAGLEIGPLDRPIMKRPGSGVLYADHLDQEGLRRKYVDHGPVNPDTIPEIDFVIGDAGLRAAVGDRRMNYVLASHVIEHVPNPLAWLDDIHAILVDGGVLVLAVPDHRRCFDALRRPTVAADWIEAFLDRRSRPSASRIFDAMCNEVSIDGQISWGNDPDSADLILSRTPAAAYELARQFHGSGEYMDVHCWTFTPDTFCDVLRVAALAGVMQLKLETITPTQGQEFFVRLVRDDSAGRPEVAASYPARGERYRRLPPDFDASTYYRLNPDVRDAGIDPNDHYLQYGRHESRAYR